MAALCTHIREEEEEEEERVGSTKLENACEYSSICIYDRDMTVKLDSFPNPYLVIFPRGAVSATTKSILTTGKVWEHWLCHVNIRWWEWRISR